MQRTKTSTVLLVVTALCGPVYAQDGKDKEQEGFCGWLGIPWCSQAIDELSTSLNKIEDKISGTAQSTPLPGGGAKQ